MRRVWHSAAILIASSMSLLGCGRDEITQPGATGLQASTQPETAAVQSGAPRIAGGAMQLHDFVRRPQIAPEEAEARPLRIVSAAPNITEICCALGLRSQLVARTRYCKYPPEVLALPDIGALIDVNIETLIGLTPDLVLLAGPSVALTDRLRPLSLRLESVPDTHLADLYTAIRRIGEWTGRPRTAAQLCEAIEAELRVVDARYARRADSRVLLLTGTLADPPRPPYVAGPGSFYEELLRRAGFRNAVGAGQRSFAMLSLEFILATDPDVIVELDADGAHRTGGDAQAREIWAKVGNLRAVRENRVRVLRGSQHYLLGPRIAMTYAALCEAIVAGGDPMQADPAQPAATHPATGGEAAP